MNEEKKELQKLVDDISQSLGDKDEKSITKAIRALNSALFSLNKLEKPKDIELEIASLLKKSIEINKESTDISTKERDELRKEIETLINFLLKGIKVNVENFPKPEKTKEFPKKIQVYFDKPAWFKSLEAKEVANPIVKAIYDAIYSAAAEQIKSLSRIEISNRDPRQAIPVRLVSKDASKFYDAIMTAVAAGGGSVFPFRTSSDRPRASLVDEDGHIQVDILSTEDDIWGTNDIDDYTTTSVTYIGKEKKDGTWWIKKLDETGNFLTINHASITNNPTLTTYTLAWAARTTATYGDYGTAF